MSLRFSICIPTYNRAHLIRAAIDTALGQLGNDFEVVVVDNASADDTPDVLAKICDSRFSWHRNPSTVSMYANHNICATHARGAWLLFLHSDDQLKPSALERYRRCVERDTGIDILTATPEYYEKAWADRDDKTLMVIQGLRGIELLFRYLGLNMPGACINASCFRAMGGFDETTYMADHDFYIRCVLAGRRIVALRESVMEIGLAERSTTRLILSKQWLFEEGRMLARHAENPNVLSTLRQSLHLWEPSEIARLLMYMAAGDNRPALDELDSVESPSVKAARAERPYRHVRLYRTLGFSAYRALALLLGRAQTALQS